jgi:deoxyadenosine/deoxycytidine kinase
LFPITDYKNQNTDSSSSKLKPKRKKMLKISVDGNISSGKSTLVSKLAEFFPKATGESGNSLFSLEIVPEPLEKWCNLNGHNLLDMFYKDSAKNNFLFQHYVQLTRLMDTVKGSADNEPDSSSKTKVRVMERSLQNNRYCFLELAKRNERMHPAEFTVLAEWYNFLEKNLDLNLDLIIYLRIKPETAFSRMKARGRVEEDSCPFEYLRDLHESYEDWLIKKTVGGDDSVVKQQVLVVDAEQSKEQVARQCFGLLEDYLKLAKPEIFRVGATPSIS